MKEMTLTEWEDWLTQHPENIDLVEHDADSELEDGRVHNTLLHLAVLGYWHQKEWPESALVSLLLRMGANPNVQNDAGKTPLHLACEFDTLSAENVRLLLKYGADPRIKDKQGDTAIDKLFGGKEQTRQIREMLEAAMRP